MALTTRCTHRRDCFESAAAKLTNYAEHLHPSHRGHEVNRGAHVWSCSHGVERWRSDCGCNTGAIHVEPWREALAKPSTGCRDEPMPSCPYGSQFCTTPAAREDYIE